MNFDRNSLTKLLALPDEQFKKVLFEIAHEAGIDTSSLSIADSDVAKLKGVLALASDSDIAELMRHFGGGKAHGK